MFVESLLESGHAHSKGRGWATTLSITLQGLSLAALVALPTFRPDRLQLEMKSITSPIAFGHADTVPETRPANRRPPAPTSEARFIYTNQPTSDAGPAVEPAPDISAIGHRGPVGRETGIPDLFNNVIPKNPPVLAVKPASPPPTRVSVADPGKITHQVQPVYPVPAKSAGIQGVVVLHAIIDREGRITGLQVVSGHPFFIESALSAVRQWRYRPYYLNGQPIEVETRITVNFKLAR